MKLQLIIFSLFLTITCRTSLAQDDCPLKGKWKSDAEATKQEIEKNKKYTKKQREKLSSEIFGKLIVEYTCTEHTTYYDGQTHQFSYKILKRNENKLTVQYIDKECDNSLISQDINSSESCNNECDGATTEQEIYLTGDCYSVGYEILGYREVFCRTN
jgi:deoxyribodipyrimidine photolyase-like uncharacterized protein